MIYRKNRLIRGGRGFTLIEVMVAVVVLSTGLLALAALQANLMRSAADSKARSRVAALVSSHLDAMRAGGYDGAASMAATGCVSGNDVCQAQTEGAIGGLTIAHQVNEVLLPGSDTARYKTVRIAAQWTDAGGGARSLSMDTVLSPTALDSSPTLVDKDLSGDSAKQPVVRTTNPATPGMIPVAVSATDSTAATNPRPELLTQGGKESVIGTKFDVLTYTNETGGNAQIQRRVETTVIGCTCQYGAGGNKLPEIYRQAQWPAVWTGERYDVYKPDGSAAAPGTTVASGPAAGVTQSALCTECCRDHHDNATSGVAKFDPERVLNQGEAVGSHYTRDSSGALVLADAAQGDVYQESCRMIRVDGLWRTAADMYSRYTGLLATGVAAGKSAPATTGVPDAAAAENYGGSTGKGITGFVKDYLAEFMNVASTSLGAGKIYDNYGLNNPLELAINRPEKNTTDERYLHLRGLYVDYLNDKARERIDSALKPTNCNGSKIECILPYVPFTTVNLTELAFWEAQTLQAGSFEADNSVIDVESASPLAYNIDQPYRGRTNAQGNANNTDTGYATAFISRSNSGVAVLRDGVDPDDDLIASELPDRQLFRVAASGGSSGTDKFTVNLAGLSQTSNTDTSDDPTVSFEIGTSVGPCGGTLDPKTKGKTDYDPNDYACNNTPALGVAGTVVIAKYGFESTQPLSLSQQCDYQGSLKSITETIDWPYFADSRVTDATVGGVPAVSTSVASPGAVLESTSVSFTSIPSNGAVRVTFVREPDVLAEFVSCTATAIKDKKGNITGYTFGTIIWTKSWQ